MKVVLAIALVLSPVTAMAGYLDQFGPDDLPRKVADEVAERGCALPDEVWSALFRKHGGHMSDFQAHAMAMHRNGQITSPDGGKTLVLKNYGACK